MITILQLIGLFIILGFSGHLYIEIEKMIKQAEEHVDRLNIQVDDFIAKREAKLAKIEEEAKQRHRAERIVWTPNGTGFEHEINSYE